MPRTAPPDRLEKLLISAARVFVAHGFHRAQMDDVAADLGVSKGTLYRSVDSKEALLAAVLTFGDTPELLPEDGLIGSGGFSAVSATLAEDLSQSVSTLALTSVLTAKTGRPLGDEVSGLALDLYQMMARHRIRIMVLNQCAPELPELAGDWHDSGRYAIVDLWVQYLDSRATGINGGASHQVLARTIVELITLWAVKMPWDPAPRQYPQDMPERCAAMVSNLVTGNNR